MLLFDSPAGKSRIRPGLDSSVRVGLGCILVKQSTSMFGCGIGHVSLFTMYSYAWLVLAIYAVSTRILFV